MSTTTDGPGLTLHSQANYYQEIRSKYWQEIRLVDRSKRSFELDWQILSTYPSSERKAAILAEAQEAIKKAIRTQSKINKSFEEVNQLIQKKPQEMEAIDKEDWEKLENTAVILRVAKKHMDDRLPKARLSLQSLQDLDSNPIARKLRYGIAWAFGTSFDTPTPLDDASRPNSSEDIAGAADSAYKACATPINAVLDDSKEAQGQKTSTEKKPKRRVEREKQYGSLSAKQTELNEKTELARKSILDMEESKRHWEMLSDVWKEKKPTNDEAIETLDTETEEFSRYQDTCEEANETHREIKNLLKKRPALVDTKQEGIWKQLEKDALILDIVCKQMNERLPCARQELQSLYDFDSYTVTRLTKRLFRLTPDLSGKDSFESKE